MSSAPCGQALRGRWLVHVTRPQQQLLLIQHHLGPSRLGCHKEGRDGQFEGLAVRSLHHLGKGGGKLEGQLARVGHLQRSAAVQGSFLKKRQIKQPCNHQPLKAGKKLSDTRCKSPSQRPKVLSVLLASLPWFFTCERGVKPSLPLRKQPRSAATVTSQLNPLSTVVDICLDLWLDLMVCDRGLVSLANWTTERSKGLSSHG